MTRKMNFDAVIESWCRKSKLESIERWEEVSSLHSKPRRSSTRTSSCSSSVSSAVVKRKEKLALAQLKKKTVIKGARIKAPNGRV